MFPIGRAGGTGAAVTDTVWRQVPVRALVEWHTRAALASGMDVAPGAMVAPGGAPRCVASIGSPMAAGASAASGRGSATGGARNGSRPGCTGRRAMNLGKRGYMESGNMTGAWRAHGDPGIVGKYADWRVFSPRPYGGYGCDSGSGDICCAGAGEGSGCLRSGLPRADGFGHGGFGCGDGNRRGTGNGEEIKNIWNRETWLTGGMR